MTLTLVTHRIIVDAAIRRFKAQKIYLRAAAALRWVNSRNQVLQGRSAGGSVSPVLQQLRNNLRVVSRSNIQSNSCFTAADLHQSRNWAPSPMSASSRYSSMPTTTSTSGWLRIRPCLSFSA